jgi:hypothetical protein
MSDIERTPETEEDHPHPSPDRGEQEAKYVEAHEKAAKESRNE